MPPSRLQEIVVDTKLISPAGEEAWSTYTGTNF